METEHTPPKKLKDRTVVPAWDVAVLNNEILFADPDGFHEHLIPLEGRDNLQLIVKRKVKPRSRQIEKYYHAVPIRMIAAEMGITDEEAHDMCKNMFLREEKSYERKDGVMVRYTRTGSTTELGDKRYYEYVFDEVVPWASRELNLYIPHPNEADWYGKDDWVPTGYEQ